ncbi:hypothetical protein BKA82DRAFT_955776 [Pisolithus tinctorius]|nr:hypothetical protein BKA82DRAFT_955776 [Pisolithus tinctorius]
MLENLQQGFTLGWAAPELLMDNLPSAKTDVWSFGMTVLELFTRKAPFHRIPHMRLVHRICTGQTPDRPTDEETLSRLTDEWWNLCLSCWRFEPLSRPTISHIVETIAKIMQHSFMSMQRSVVLHDFGPSSASQIACDANELKVLTDQESLLCACAGKIRLINVDVFLGLQVGHHGEKAVTEVFGEFYDTEICHVQYAVLSHCWCVAEAEVQFGDLTLGMFNVHHRGYQKIVKACEKACADGLEWLWTDSTCINEDDISEFSESVNSRYHWQANSEQCYVYLDDVDGPTFPTERDHQKFSASGGWPQWFSCSWTLSDLLAPNKVSFFNQHWQFIGDKRNLLAVLTTITCIPEDILCHGLPSQQHPDHPSVAQILSWAADRNGRKKEDRAYALLGLFRVHMQTQYGEGGHAFHHLQEAIIGDYNDHSIFVWSGEGRHGSILAESPDDFRDSADVIRLSPPHAYTKECPEAEAQIKSHRWFELTGKGVEIWLPVTHCADSQEYIQVKLACCHQSSNGELITLNLARASSQDEGVYGRTLENFTLSSAKPGFQKLYLVCNGM